MNSENPYSSPSVDGPDTPTKQIESASNLSEIAKRTFLAWEKLRLAYLAILALVTVASFFVIGNVSVGEFIFAAVFGGILANVCYFAAPMVETYIGWLGFPTRALRIALFALGTGFTALMAVYSIWELSL